MAYAEDGLIEAFCMKDDFETKKKNLANFLFVDDPLSKFTVGLQFHPERMLSEYAGNYLVFKNFVKAVKETMELKRNGQEKVTTKPVRTFFDNNVFVFFKKVYMDTYNLSLLFQLVSNNDFDNVKRILDHDKKLLQERDFDKRTGEISIKEEIC